MQCNCQLDLGAKETDNGNINILRNTTQDSHDAQLHTCARVVDELCAERGNIAGVLGFSSGAKLRTGLRLTSSLPAADFPVITGPVLGFPAITDVLIIIGGIIGAYVPGGCWNGIPCIGIDSDDDDDDEDGLTP